jgi:hypothetical protein
MKRKNFLSLTIIAIAIILTIGFTSCKKEPCVKENFGTVVVTNLTGFSIYVDVTYADGPDFNDERFLNAGQSTEYQMTPGEVIEWATPAADYACNCNWYTDQYYLAQCDIHDDPWGSVKGESLYKDGRSIKSNRNKE